MKKVIRLTEGDLHKIINESVKKVIKEVKFGNTDRSFHADDPSAWEALKITRNGRANKALQNHDFYGYGKNLAQANRNASNEFDARYPEGSYRYAGDVHNPNMYSVMQRLEEVPANQLSTEEIEWMINVIKNENNNGYKKPWKKNNFDDNAWEYNTKIEDNLINYLTQELENRNGNSAGGDYDMSKPYFSN